MSSYQSLYILFLLRRNSLIKHWCHQAWYLCYTRWIEVLWILLFPLSNLQTLVILSITGMQAVLSWVFTWVLQECLGSELKFSHFSPKRLIHWGICPAPIMHFKVVQIWVHLNIQIQIWKLYWNFLVLGCLIIFSFPGSTSIT